MQVSGGSQSFNTVNQLRILGAMDAPSDHSKSIFSCKAFNEFDEDGRMKPSPYYNRLVDVMEELFKFTLLTRHNRDYLVDRYSERVETAEQLSKRVNSSS